MKTFPFSRRHADYLIAFCLTSAIFGLIYFAFFYVFSSTPIQLHQIQLSHLLIPKTPTPPTKPQSTPPKPQKPTQAPTKPTQPKPTQPKPTTQTTSKPPTPPTPQSSPQPTESKQSKATQSTQTTPQEENSQEPIPQEQVSPQITTIFLDHAQQDDFLSKIYQIIQENITLPRMARYKKLSGSLLVEFQLSEQGISNLKILKSSNHAILDQNAIQSIQKASTLFPKAKQAYKIQVPIKYQ